MEKTAHLQISKPKESDKTKLCLLKKNEASLKNITLPYFKCDLCLKLFKSSNSLKFHRKLHSGERPYKCNLCDKTYSRSSCLDVHQKIIHSGIKPFNCNYCDKKFAMKYKLTTHLLIHSDEKLHMCTYCKKTFKYLTGLQIHERTHSGLNFVECAHCEKKFISKSSLIRHFPVHTGKRLYKCLLCKKQFKYLSNLQNHQKIHSNLKSFTCEHCKKGFITKNELKSHLAVHSNDRPLYKCLLCKKTYKYKTYLIIHKKIHANKKNFECHKCKRKFVLKSYLKKHLKRNCCKTEKNIFKMKRCFVFLLKCDNKIQNISNKIKLDLFDNNLSETQIICDNELKNQSDEIETLDSLKTSTNLNAQNITKIIDSEISEINKSINKISLNDVKISDDQTNAHVNKNNEISSGVSSSNAASKTSEILHSNLSSTKNNNSLEVSSESMIDSINFSIKNEDLNLINSIISQDNEDHSDLDDEDDFILFYDESKNESLNKQSSEMVIHESVCLSDKSSFNEIIENLETLIKDDSCI